MLFAVFVVVLLGMSTLVVDAGLMIVQRRIAQNAAGAAALAGAYSISIGASDAGVQAMVHEYAITSNRADDFQ